MRAPTKDLDPTLGYVAEASQLFKAYNRAKAKKDFKPYSEMAIIDKDCPRGRHPLKEKAMG